MLLPCIRWKSWHRGGKGGGGLRICASESLRVCGGWGEGLCAPDGVGVVGGGGVCSK